MQTKLVNKIKQSKGQFFGLYTKNGEVINAQFVGETPCYIRVYDRNQFLHRKIAKSNIRGVKVGATVVGQVPV